jgi:type II secretory pathway pseudopilin PulG
VKLLRPTWTVVGALAAVMLALGACGGSGDSISSSASTSADASAQDAQAEATARTAQTVMETYATDQGGSYAGADTKALTQIEPKLDVSSINVTANSSAYSVTVNSDSGNTFTVARNSSGATKFICTDAGVGNCPASGDWGTKP